MFAISVLGPFELRRDNEPVRVPAGKATEVLIRLALDAGVMVQYTVFGSSGAVVVTAVTSVLALLLARHRER